jgi:hypothetical protein
MTTIEKGGRSGDGCKRVNDQFLQLVAETLRRDGRVSFKSMFHRWLNCWEKGSEPIRKRGEKPGGIVALEPSSRKEEAESEYLAIGTPTRNRMSDRGLSRTSRPVQPAYWVIIFPRSRPSQNLV